VVAYQKHGYELLNYTKVVEILGQLSDHKPLRTCTGLQCCFAVTVCSGVRKISEIGFQFRHVRLCFRIEQFVFHWTDFHKISYFIIFVKYVKKFWFSLTYYGSKRGEIAQSV